MIRSILGHDRSLRATLAMELSELAGPYEQLNHGFVQALTIGALLLELGMESDCVDLDVFD